MILLCKLKLTSVVVAAAAAQAVEHPPIVEALAGRTAHSALPVIIVIQQQQQLQRPGGQVERAAQLAARTNCVLVTLNYRTGLLGEYCGAR